MSFEKQVIRDCVLYRGDCLEVLPTLKGLESERLAIVTDPPFGIYDCGGKWGKKQDLQWDREPAKGIEELVKGKPAIVWGGNYFKLPPSRGWLVWYKRDSVPSAADVELAWTSFDMNSQLIDQTIAATNAERCGHPTQKPTRVMRWCMTFLPYSTQVVVDPFMGSGTTGVACIGSGRKFIGIELERRYFDIACRCIEKAYADGAILDLAGKPARYKQPSLLETPC